MYHQPVLLHESVDGLNIDPNGIYVDVTFGGGGHSKMILEKLENGKLVAFDQDPDAKRNLPDDDRLIFVNENFRLITPMLKMYKAYPVDGILADLGVSSWQIDSESRGFSTRFNGPLDMRMNPDIASTAKSVLLNYTLQELTNVFRNYGELKNAYRIAQEIIAKREDVSLDSTSQLVDMIQQLAPRNKRHKFLAQVFQAIRIEVNDEMNTLKDFLTQSLDLLKEQGRLVVISYHSLEDRLVKNFLRSGNFDGKVEKDLFFGNSLSQIKQVGKLIIPSEKELERNNRSRSARLRIGEKIKS